MEKNLVPVTGIIRDVKKAIETRKDVMAFNAAPNNRFHLTTVACKKFVYLAGDVSEARTAYNRITKYGDGNYVLLPEKEDSLTKRMICDYSSMGERIKILAGLLDGSIDGVVLSCESFLARYPEKERFIDATITFRKNCEIKTSDLAERLLYAGYKRDTDVKTPATFRLSGDVLEIFPPASFCPYRVDFFGDTVEKIRVYEPETHVASEEKDALTVLPASDVLVRQNEANGILNSIRKAARTLAPEMRSAASDAMESFTRNPSDALNGFILPFLKEQTAPFLTYAKNFTLVVDDVRQIEDKLKLTRKAFENRAETLAEGGKAFGCHKEAIFTESGALAPRGEILGFGRTTSAVRLFRPQEIFDLKTSPLAPFYNDIEGFFTLVKQLLLRGVKIRVYVANEGSLGALESAFNDHDIGVQIGFSSDADIALQVGDVEYGFYYPTEKFMCVGINDLTRKQQPIRKKPKKQTFELPLKGDYVVHEKHGIGISEGMQRVKTLSGEKDFFVVLYKGGDKLFLPVEQLDAIEKYTGTDKPALHKLGGAEFERVKERVRQSVKEMAIDLLEIYRAREGRKGYKYQSDTPWQKELEDDFEFTETEDQLVAIADIKRDMESGKIMDRLLCGDVGYGKTEVAIRAIFKTVIEGKQAALLAPTTVLAQQHYNLICARMNKFKLKIELLSRFVPPSEIKKSLERIKSGESNIIVATHRLLGGDVVFHDLGLLVLDEEQRFGVEHKEKLKAFKSTVNVLSMSATPIPRTLHMALSGIRDISTLDTPPKNRLPVETYVTEYSEELLNDALERELNRGGQAFVLYNRVKGINKFRDTVISLVGDRTEVVCAHGQMSEEELETAIKKFYDGDAGVLVSTTIIENGVDLPNANTLFVIDADNLGLSQLYQLRGRVGRSNVLAYAYFTVREGKVLTETAVKRLDALMSNTELGSGFKIAMQDLEIRGAGNILGREQHGQMEKVGYEMYLRLVKEGIERAQGKEIEEEREVELKIDGDMALKESYIPEVKARTAVYRTAAQLTCTKDGNEFYKELSASYGDDARLKNIVRTGILKNVAKKLGVKKVVIGSAGSGIYFDNSDILKEKRLYETLERYKSVAVLCPTNPPSVVFGIAKLAQSARIKFVKDFLEEIKG